MFAPPSEYSRYDFHKDILPPGINPEALKHLGNMTELLRKHLPNISTISNLVALPWGRSWKYQSASQGANLIVFGTFRSEYRAILAMAEVLEDFYVDTLFLPTIVPVKRAVWLRQLESEGLVLRSIRNLGLTAYSERLRCG